MITRSHHYVEYLRNGTEYRHRVEYYCEFTHALLMQQCHFEWPWVTLSDLAKYSMTRIVARSLCDSWASCLLYSYQCNVKARLQQHNSTQLDVLRRRSVYSDADATQLNSTLPTCFTLIGCMLFNWVSCIADRRRQLSCVGEGVHSDATQLNSTSSWVVSL